MVDLPSKTHHVETKPLSKFDMIKLLYKLPKGMV